MNNTYESIFICPGDITQEKVENTLEKVKTVITRTEGKVTSAELWGRRKLAYPIKRHRDGFYVYLVFSSPGAVLSSLNHHYRVTDTILRGLTVKVDPRHLEKMRTVPRPAEGAASPEAAAQGAPTAAPAAAAPAAAAPAAPASAPTKPV